MNFRIENPRSRAAVFWGGLALIVAGLLVALIGIRSAIRERAASRDLESMAGDLRANGAIVENYYKVLADKEARTATGIKRWSFLVTGVLVAAGASMMVIGGRQAAENAPSGGAGVPK